MGVVRPAVHRERERVSMDGGVATEGGARTGAAERGRRAIGAGRTADAPS
jgi:hypothetical protein